VPRWRRRHQNWPRCRPCRCACQGRQLDQGVPAGNKILCVSSASIVPTPPAIMIGL
jgi:hypothetical protein